ncbi:MAG: class I adenylate-forming enzyme family protein [Desulfocucumaceae bacterium]
MDNQQRLSEIAGLMPGKLATVWQSGQLTYEQLNAKVNQVGWLLKKLGVQKGERVAVQLLNVPEFIFSYYAIFRIGAIMVPINPIYRKREIEYIIRDSGPKVLITAPEFMGEIDQNGTERPTIILISDSRIERTLSLEELMAEQSTADIPVEYDYEDIAEIIYTSGTTGVPKGVMLSHRNIHTNIQAIIKELEISDSERTLIVAPLFHIAAQTNCMATTFYAGGTNYLIPRWVSALDTLTALAENKITYYFGPPTMHALILNVPDSKKYDLSSLRIPLTGAAPMPVEVYTRFKEWLGIEPLEGYGLSETAPVVSLNPLRGRRKPGSIGLTLDGISVKIVDSGGNELPPGEVGEIAIKGPNVFRSYWNKEAETKEVLRGDWFHTGDLAYKDEEGYIFIVDRKKDMIIRGGLNIYPREVEEEVYKYPGVMECAVVGSQDPVMGEEVTLFLTVKEGYKIDFNDLKSFCLERMAKYKVPKYIKIIDELPKTASGKTMKPELRKLAAEIFTGRG